MKKRFTAFALALVMACGVLPMGAAASGSELFAQMSGLTFNFASGAGGWWTEFTMNGDGSFKGNYHDSEIGSMGRDYPKGTVYVCKFSGRFTGVKRISGLEYSMELESLEYDASGRSWIEDGIRYIAGTPYGLDNAKELRVYLPGSKTSELPAPFVDWVSMPNAWSRPPAELPFWGLYNVNGEQGFFSAEAQLGGI